MELFDFSQNFISYFVSSAFYFLHFHHSHCFLVVFVQILPTTANFTFLLENLKAILNCLSWILISLSLSLEMFDLTLIFTIRMFLNCQCTFYIPWNGCFQWCCFQWCCFELSCQMTLWFFSQHFPAPYFCFSFHVCFANACWVGLAANERFVAFSICIRRFKSRFCHLDFFLVCRRQFVFISNYHLVRFKKFCIWANVGNKFVFNNAKVELHLGFKLKFLFLI